MNHEIDGTPATESIEIALDAVMGNAKESDRIVLTYGAAARLLDEIDELRNESEPVKPRFLHVMTTNVEHLIRVETISVAFVDQKGMATVSFIGGGVVQFDAVAWRLLFAQIKQRAELEMVPIAPSSKLVQA